MTNPSAFGRRPGKSQQIPAGDELGTFGTYAAAQAVVDRLAQAEFDVRSLSIIGNDLKTVERITGKLSYGRSAAGGAATGGYLGLFVGVLIILIAPETGLGYVAAAVLIGAGLGVLLGIVRYAVNRRRRDFTSATTVLASSYTVIVDPEFTARARALLDRSS